jgi:hypothetical protein
LGLAAGYPLEFSGDNVVARFGLISAFDTEKQ